MPIVYFRLVVYSVASIILLLFSVLLKERTRRLRNLFLAIFFVTIIVSLFSRLAIGPDAQNTVNDLMTTPAAFIYTVFLVIDFYRVGRNGGRKIGNGNNESH